LKAEAVQLRQDKASLRQHFIQARKQFAQSGSATAQSLLEKNMRRLMDDLKAKDLQIVLYRPLPGEASFQFTPASGFFYPALEGDRLRMLSPRGAWRRGAFGIEVPDPSSSLCLQPGRPAIVFCPAVAVDAYGTRIGMGKGYYDRFFADHPGVIRVGVIYQVQFSKDPLPRDSWDQPLDWIVSETMILATSNEGVS